jgi:hypothetical protein
MISADALIKRDPADKTEQVAASVCQHGGLDRNDPATSKVPGHPAGLRSSCSVADGGILEPSRRFSGRCVDQFLGLRPISLLARRGMASLHHANRVVLLRCALCVRRQGGELMGRHKWWWADALQASESQNSRQPPLSASND